MNKVEIALKLIEIAPRFLPHSKPPVTDYSPLYDRLREQAIPDTIQIETPHTVITQSTEPIFEFDPISDEDTIKHQEQSLIKELTLIEGHLREKGRILGKPCDCLAKHGLTLDALATETISINPEKTKFYSAIAEIGKELQQKGTPRAVASQEYDDDYPILAAKIRQFRKILQASQDQSEFDMEY